MCIRDSRNDGPTATDTQQDIDDTRHTLADAATNRFDTYCVELHGCTADYSGDRTDACRRLSDAEHAATAADRNDGPTATDTQQDIDDTRHTLADATTNRFDADSADLQVDTENKTSTPQNNTKHYTSEINNFINGKRLPAPSPSVNAIVNGADAS